MNPIPHSLAETRSETIFRHTEQMMRERRITEPTFATTLVEIYHQRTPAQARRVNFPPIDDVFDQAKAWAQKVFRYAEPGVSARLPDDLEEAWVLALDDPYRQRCLDDLAARYGLLAVPHPSQAGEMDLQAVGQLAKSLGDVLSAFAPVFSDGKIDEFDAPFIGAVIEHLRRMSSQAEGLLVQMECVQQRIATHLP